MQQHNKLSVARWQTLKWMFRAFGLKTVYLLLIFGSLILWQGPDPNKFHAVNARWPRSGEPVFASHFATWDAAHYLSLSEVGYHRGVPSCAFYPLWPLLVRWSAPLFGGSHVVAGMVLSNVCSLLAWLLFYQMTRARWGPRAAGWALVFLMVFPGSLFFQFNYTESLFLLLVLGLWWGLERRRYDVAWVCAGLLPLTRAVGLFAVLPIGWHALRVASPGWWRRWVSPWRRGDAAQPSNNQRGWRMENGRSSAPPPSEKSSQQTTKRGEGTAEGESGVGLAGASPYRAGAFGPQPSAFGLRVRPWWLLAAPLLGWGIYLALMWYWTGNPFEGFAAQKSWGVHSIGNLVNVPKFVIGFFTPTAWHEFTGSLLDRCLFLVLLWCLPVLWRLDKGLLVWTYVLGILPAMSGTFTSYTRFASCVFPVFIALGVFLERREWRWLRYGLLAVFLLLHIVLVWRFVNFRWAG